MLLPIILLFLCCGPSLLEAALPKAACEPIAPTDDDSSLPRYIPSRTRDSLNTDSLEFYWCCRYDEQGHQSECCTNQPCRTTLGGCPKVGFIDAETDVAVFYFESITIPESHILTIQGSRPAVLISRGPINVSGTLDSGGFPRPSSLSSAGGAGAGAGGGFLGQSGQGNGGGYAVDDVTVYNMRAGGGGGGFVGKGGTGGEYSKANNLGAGALGGESYYVSSSEISVQGGSGGGASWKTAKANVFKGHGGGGGGAIFLSSYESIFIGQSGLIDASGADGTKGDREPRRNSERAGSGGAGGGSGGLVILRAPYIENQGIIDASGGNGGGGYPQSQANKCFTPKTSGGGGGGGGFIMTSSESLKTHGQNYDASGGSGGALGYQCAMQPEVTVYPGEAGEAGIVTDGSELLCNTPPDCASAQVTPNELWPPNNKMVRLDIAVDDPDEDAVSVAITNITQNEPLKNYRDGDATFDPLQVRASRSGKCKGGRKYGIEFLAVDSEGATCTGTVTVVVKHDGRSDRRNLRNRDKKNVFDVAGHL